MSRLTRLARLASSQLSVSGLHAAGERLGKRLPRLPSWFAWGVYTCVCFVIFVVWTFPAEVIVDRILGGVKS